MLPLEVTRIITHEVDAPDTTIDAPIFLTSRQEDRSSYLASNRARAFLFTRDGADGPINGLIDLGSPTLDRVLAGAPVLATGSASMTCRAVGLAARRRLARSIANSRWPQSTGSRSSPLLR